MPGWSIGIARDDTPERTSTASLRTTCKRSPAHGEVSVSEAWERDLKISPIALAATIAAHSSTAHRTPGGGCGFKASEMRIPRRRHPDRHRHSRHLRAQVHGAGFAAWTAHFQIGGSRWWGNAPRIACASGAGAADFLHQRSQCKTIGSVRKVVRTN